MGTHFLKAPTFSPGGSNLFARSIAAPGYAARGFSGAGMKDVGAAAGLAKGVLKPTKKDAASNAPGPKGI
jgi:hypothetical protein